MISAQLEAYVDAVLLCRDGVADAMGIDDRDPRVQWVTDQERGPACLRVEVYRA